MQGDFSVLYFDPRENERGVTPPGNGVLRNVNGVLHQQTLTLTPGNHNLYLTTTAQEGQSR